MKLLIFIFKLWGLSKSQKETLSATGENKYQLWTFSLVAILEKWLQDCNNDSSWRVQNNWTIWSSAGLVWLIKVRMTPKAKTTTVQKQDERLNGVQDFGGNILQTDWKVADQLHLPPNWQHFRSSEWSKVKNRGSGFHQATQMCFSSVLIQKVGLTGRSVSLFPAICAIGFQMWKYIFVA